MSGRGDVIVRPMKRIGCYCGTHLLLKYDDALLEAAKRIDLTLASLGPVVLCLIDAPHEAAAKSPELTLLGQSTEVWWVYLDRSDTP